MIGRRWPAWTLGLCCFAFFSTAQAQGNKDYAFMGLGVSTCAKFAEMYKLSPDQAELSFFTWAQGFMSGLNSVLLVRRQPFTNLAAWDTDRQEQYLRYYCSDHP